MADPNPFDKIAIEAAAETNEALAGEQAKVALNPAVLKRLLPKPADQKALDELIQIVNGATDHNQQVADLISNISKVGGVVVKLLGNIR